MRNTFLRKILAIVLAAVLLSAVMTLLVFRMTGIGVYSEIQLNELQPRAAFLAKRSAQYLLGTIGYREYQSIVVENNSIWGAAPYIFTVDGTLFVYPPDTDTEAGKRTLSFVESYLPTVLSGNSVSIRSSFAADTLIGEPIYGKTGNVIGAVFLLKPLSELRTAMKSLWTALLIAVCVITLLMILPAYLVSRRVAKPLRQMNEAALAMAHGNFSIRADVRGSDEVAQLGSSINYLSEALSKTISDLIFERNRLRTTLDGLGEGVIGLNAEARVMQYNPAAVMLLGGCEQVNLGSIPVFADTILPKAADAIAKAEDFSFEEKVGERIISVSLSLLKGTQGSIAGGILLVRDNTESARLEQTRRDYVANVSHELRTPLASIRSLSDALSDGLVKKEEDRIRYYGYIQKESMRLSRLIDDLLELSRLQSGTIAFEKRKMDVAELVYDVAERYKMSAEESGHRLQLQMPDVIPFAYGNQDRVEQVLIILLDNAFKHASENSAVSLAVAEKTDKLEITVSNKGTINREDLPHVFERFYKADKAHTGNGTGLGLSIAKEIIKLMGETITVECEDETVRFRFTISTHLQKNAKQV